MIMPVIKHQHFHVAPCPVSSSDLARRVMSGLCFNRCIKAEKWPQMCSIYSFTGGYHFCNKSLIILYDINRWCKQSWSRISFPWDPWGGGERRRMCFFFFFNIKAVRDQEHRPEQQAHELSRELPFPFSSKNTNGNREAGTRSNSFMRTFVPRRRVPVC